MQPIQTKYADLAFGSELFTADFWETVTVSFEQDSTEVRSLGGLIDTVNQLPAVTVTATLLKANTETLAKLFPHFANLGGVNGDQIIMSSTSCGNPYTRAPLNIHISCYDNDAQDITLPNADIKMNGSFEYTEDGVRQLEIEWTALPAPATDAHPGAIVILGTGDLTQVSKFDPATGTFIAA